MDNNKQHVSYPLIICLLIVLGCHSKRDLGTDPATSPVIVPTELNYNTQESKIVVNWEYLGVPPPVRYRLKRYERETVYLFDWQDIPVSRDITQSADVWYMNPIEDLRINSGESYLYFMQTETEEARNFIEASVGSIQIPGAYLNFLTLQPEKSEATLQWNVITTPPVKYELFRQTGDEPPISVFQSQNPQDKRFADKLPEGNKTYTYTLRNYWDENRYLDSRPMSIRAYHRDLEFNAYASSNDHLSLTSASPSGTSVLALTVTPNTFILHTLENIIDANISNPLQAQIFDDFSLTPIAPQEIELPNQDRLDQKSLAIVQHNTRLYWGTLITSILQDTRQVQFTAYSHQIDQYENIEWNYSPWTVDDVNLPTVLTISSAGYIFVGAGQKISLSLAEQTIEEQTQFDLNISGNIKSMTSINKSLWITTTDGQLLRSTPIDIVFGNITTPIFMPIPLPANAIPISLTSDGTTVFVLDQNTKRVLSFDSEGNPGLWWQGFDDLDLSESGIAVSNASDVYIWDAQNHITRFRNSPAFLKRLEEGLAQTEAP